ncbi:TM2 domain-containing protein [Deinococcus apachensis]|uniref:TM2 domain-containing protein n=1 Tax=Deinococcus apachensis TaxID=309886 RepID=UPI000375C292|nr:NINE protein [Deinococcus apachensis]
MTKPEDPTPGHEPDPKPSVPSWVDEVLRAEPSPAPTRPATEEAGDLRIPEEPRPQPAPTVVTATTRSHTDEADWVARATGGTARSPSMPVGEPQVAPPLPSRPSAWPEPPRSLSSGNVPADIPQKKLIAGLLAIVLGSLGVHKFYLGMNTPGVIMLGANVGVWILALLLGLITLGFGLIITVPLAILVSSAIGLLGLIEGILYLTKSDGDFYTQYVLGKKPWL